MSAIIEEIKKIDPETNVELWHTGGGCMTIYVGNPDQDGIYPVAAGPGYMQNDKAVGDFGDFCYGVDGDGPFGIIEFQISDAEIARQIYSFYEYMNIER